MVGQPAHWAYPSGNLIDEPTGQLTNDWQPRSTHIRHGGRGSTDALRQQVLSGPGILGVPLRFRQLLLLGIHIDGSVSNRRWNLFTSETMVVVDLLLLRLRTWIMST